MPVVTVTEAKGGRLAETEVRRVDVSLLGTHKKNERRDGNASVFCRHSFRPGIGQHPGRAAALYASP
ncbi:MAG: hypothetical protein LC660_07005 [Desulfobacteraceae bacterium]|nr:hypothetical protein [Desulfobacteraceae bacterium]